MSIASRLTSIKNHIEEAYTEISRLGVDLTNVDKNIDNIADKLQEAYSQAPKVTGEGSNLSLTPTRKGGLSIIPKGACEQDSYSGKNKVDYDGTQVTLVQNTVRTKYIRPDNFPITLQAGTYVISFPDLVCVNSNYTNTLGVQLIKAGGGNIPLFVSNDTKQISFTLNEELNFTHLYLYIRGTDNSNATATFSKIQIESGSTATDFEKYVGGIPSPNPDYPQDIRVVTGDNSVVVQNKNLFDYSKIVNMALSADAISVTNNYKGFYIPYKKGTTLTLSRDTISSEKNNRFRYAFTYEEPLGGVKAYNSTGGTTYTDLDNSLSGTISSNLDFKYLFVYLSNNNSTGITENDVKIQLEYGSTATTYVAHQEQTYTLHLGTEYLAGIGDYKDEIVGKTDDWKIVRKVRHLSLAIADMDSAENYPGWINQNIIVNDLNLTQNVQFNNVVSFVSNLSNIKIYQININGLFYLVRNSWSEGGNNYTKSYWLENYPNLVLELYYQIKNEQAQYEETITDQTLISDLNNMYQASGYDGTTNMTITSNPSNAQMTASVSALKGE